MNTTPDRKDSVEWRRYEQMRPRTAIEIDAVTLAGYTGHFQFDDGVAAAVTLDGKALFIQLLGQPRAQLFPEALDAFFIKVVPAQITFARAAGFVSSLTLHQNGFELPAQRIDRSAFKELEKALEERVARTEPFENGEKVLRAMIEDQRRGEPDYAIMSAPLAHAVREQLPLLREELERLGELQTATLSKVSTEGFDQYALEFAHGKMEGGISIAPSGEVNGMFIRRPD
ncbi:MAG: DUF3471 domain-containing protein [Pseudomonadota bacterium]